MPTKLLMGSKILHRNNMLLSISNLLHKLPLTYSRSKILHSQYQLKMNYLLIKQLPTRQIFSSYSVKRRRKGRMMASKGKWNTSKSSRRMCLRTPFRRLPTRRSLELAKDLLMFNLPMRAKLSPTSLS